jgi:molybdate transport system substrate-binding protein
MIKSFYFLACLILWLAGCGVPSTGGLTQTEASSRATRPQNLTVFAAASLIDPFNAIGEQFQAGHPGVRVAYNFAGSQQLVQQLAQGAPADVFASADTKQMDAAVQAGSVLTGSPQVFAHNRLVVVFPKDNPGGLESLQDLAKPGLRLVLADKAVPVGNYSLNFLDRASQQADYGPGFKEKVLKNVLSYEENVKAVLSKVLLGEADAGIIYTSDISQANAGKVGQLNIPDALNPTISYTIAPVSGSPTPELANAFVDFVLSPQGQAILKSHGFIPVK